MEEILSQGVFPEIHRLEEEKLYSRLTDEITNLMQGLILTQLLKETINEVNIDPPEEAPILELDKTPSGKKFKTPQRKSIKNDPLEQSNSKTSLAKQKALKSMSQSLISNTEVKKPPTAKKGEGSMTKHLSSIVGASAEKGRNKLD